MTESSVTEAAPSSTASTSSPSSNCSKPSSSLSITARFVLVFLRVVAFDDDVVAAAAAVALAFAVFPVLVKPFAAPAAAAATDGFRVRFGTEIACLHGIGN